MREQPMRVLANARTAIDTLSSRGPLSPSALGEALGIPRGTAYRLVSGLNAIDFTEHVAGGRVGLSRRFLRLADAAAEGLVEWSDAHGTLANLATTTGHTAFLAVPRGNSVLCIDSVIGHASDAWIIRRGLTFAPNVGPGRLFLAYRRDPGDLPDQSALTPLTDKTLCTVEELQSDMRMIINRGYLIALEDVMPLMALVCLPVFKPSGVIHGCLALGGQLAEVLANEDYLVDVLRSAAADLTVPLASQSRA